VPPRILFSKPCPQNMLTVPACADCNELFKMDDEYTRAVIALDVRAATHKDVIGSLATLMRSLHDPRAVGFAKYLNREMSPTPILAANGARITKLALDLRRVNATGEHMVRGLHYWHRKMPVDPLAVIKIASQPDVAVSDPMLLDAVRLYDAFPDKFTGEVGTAFSYAAAFSGQRSVWVMMLYGYFFWFVTVSEDPNDCANVKDGLS
jgi:hypothetical protein